MTLNNIKKDEPADESTVLKDIREHAVPIIVAVLTSVTIGRLGIVWTIVCLAAGSLWIAWHAGWRVNLTTQQTTNEQQEEDHEDVEHDICPQ